MKFMGFLLLVVGVVLVVGGVMMYRSTAPNGDVVPQGESSLEEVPEKGTSNSQFLQMKPDLPAPDDDGDNNEGAAVSPTEDVSPTASPVGEGGREVAVVSMTDVGFSPETITVTQGNTVKFVNNGQALHWPVSDIFDAERGIATGDEYTFTFSEVGTWPFYDHLNPQLKGSVVVEQR
ncbi:MAG: cupredoxin domain-containing protein [bacterium]